MKYPRIIDYPGEWPSQTDRTSQRRKREQDRKKAERAVAILLLCAFVLIAIGLSARVYHDSRRPTVITNGVKP